MEIRDAKSDFELLDIVRRRYQMYVRNITELRGFITGYGLAKIDYESNLPDFSKYLTDLKKVNPYAVSWDSLIAEEAGEQDYEIPLFFTYLDEFRNIQAEVLCEVDLTWDHREFDFRRMLKNTNIDYPSLPIKAPHILKAVKIPGVSVHAFYFDETGFKYYEQCLRDLDYLKSWAKECFNINEEEWRLS